MYGRRRFLAASVISVQNSNFVYPSCQNCFSRLHLDLERYSCLKCGCSGDAREASYRYRLSLEVANSHEVFLVTVFGSCLEAFFGVPAKSLQRYIEDLNPEATGGATGDASPSVVIQAVESCFVGKKFIFGVKGSEKQDGVGRLQNDSRVGRCPKALTACQMFVPNPGLVGCTVLRHLHQQQCSSRSQISHEGARSPSGLFTALDQPSGELSGLPSSGDCDAVPSGHANHLSSLWPQSFGLASLSVSGGAAVDPTALGSSRTACDEQTWDDSPVSPLHHCQSIDNSQNDKLTVNERDVQEDDKLRLCSTWHDSSVVTKDAQSHSSERDDSGSLQSLLEKGKKDSPGQISIRCSRGLEKSPNPLRGYSFSPLISCASRSRSSQGDPWFWDELPSSESLNEFIARIENGEAAVSPTEARARGRIPSERAGEIHGPVDQLPLQLHAASATGQAHEKLQEEAEKEEASKEPVLSRHQPNRLSFSGKEYQQGVSFRYSSTQGKDEWELLSSHHQILLPQLSPVGIKPSGSKGSCPSSKEGGGRDAAGCENHHIPASLKTASNCHTGPAHLNCMQEGNVSGWRKKFRSCRELKQTSDPTDVQGQGFTSAACEKPDKVCERQPFQDMHENNCKGGEISRLLQDSSICPQGGYNASADLFDVSATGVEVVAGMLSMAQAFSAQGGASTSKSAPSGRKPSESEASWNTSQSGLSFLDLFAASNPKASTPVVGSAVDSERSPSGTQDFVLSSQSTPRVRPCQQARLPRGKESIFSELPLNRLPWIDARWKRPRPAFKGPLVKQLVGKFLQSRRLSNVCSATMDTLTTPGLIINGSPAQELSENDLEEWIPPSEKKREQPLPFQNQKTFGLRRRRFGDIMEKSPLSEKQTGWKAPRGATGLARTEFTPNSQRPTEATVHEGVADPQRVMVVSPGSCTFSDGSRSNRTSTPRSTPDTVNWSPELFGDNSRLFTP
uniref:DNA damage-induced apoptosis suppressor protein n=1 Tax=Euleptes europaea TaxID=460621 RepID=UPI00254006BA|nr:DNA damage-induced apoptosis suppressor protein [Euleptes europaea]